MIDENEIKQILRDQCEAAGSQRAWAKKNGFSEPYVSMMLTGDKPISKKTAKVLGFSTKVNFIACNPEKDGA